MSKKDEPRCPHHDLIIEITGRSGKNGRIGNLEKRMSYTNKRIDEANTRLGEVEKLANKLAIKLGLATFAGSGLVTVAIKLIG